MSGKHACCREWHARSALRGVKFCLSFLTCARCHRLKKLKRILQLKRTGNWDNDWDRWSRAALPTPAREGKSSAHRPMSRWCTVYACSCHNRRPAVCVVTSFYLSSTVPSSPHTRVVPVRCFDSFCLCLADEEGSED